MVFGTFFKGTKRPSPKNQSGGIPSGSIKMDSFHEHGPPAPANATDPDPANASNSNDDEPSSQCAQTAETAQTAQTAQSTARPSLLKFNIVSKWMAKNGNAQVPTEEEAHGYQLKEYPVEYHHQSSTNLNAMSDSNHSQQHLQNSQHSQSPQSPQEQNLLQELLHYVINRSWKKKLCTAIVTISFIPIAADIFVFRTGYVHGFIDRFLGWMRYHGALGVWAYIAMLVLTSLVFIPPSFLIFSSGFIFSDIYGPFYGILIALLSSYIGTVLGGTLGFLRAQYMTRDLIQILMRRYPIIQAIDKAIVRNELRVMILMRLNPLIPFGVLNYIFGITGVDGVVFVMSMVGVVPWHFWLVYVGSVTDSLYEEGEGEMSMGKVILMSMGVAFGVIGLVITWRFAKKELQKEVLDPAPSIKDYRIQDDSLKPVVLRHTPNSIEEADLYFTDYVLMQYLGKEDEIDGLDSDYQSKLDWTEIILDDFS